MKSILSLTLVSLAAVSGVPFAAETGKNVNTAKTTYISNLLQRATPAATASASATFPEQTQEKNQRLLESREPKTTISSFWLRFEKCQFVKEYDDEIAAYDRGSDTVFATEDFVVFRLCPSDDSCHSECSENFGEYAVPLRDYVRETVIYQQRIQEEMCETCYDQCIPAGSGVECQKCVDECSMIENMEYNGYIDAAEFDNCQMIYDPEYGKPLYAGPTCGGHGAKINIGIFTDEDCKIEDPSKSVDDYLMDSWGHHMKLAHALLKNVYNRDNCISCSYPKDPTNEKKTLRMCESLYYESAKCETPHGFNNGEPVRDGQSKNQVAQEDAVCDFVETLKGEKSLSEELHVFLESRNKGNTPSTKRQSTTSTTKGQSLLLDFSVLACVVLTGTAMLLHRKLMKNTKSSFTDSGANANYELIPIEGNKGDDYQELS